MGTMDADSGPLEVHLPDGGRVTITGDVDAVIEAVVHASGGVSDVEEALRLEAEAQGLTCVASGRGPSTVVKVGDR